MNDFNSLQFTTANLNSCSVVSVNDVYALNIFQNGLEDLYKQTIFGARPKSLPKTISSFKTEKNFLYKDNNSQNRNQNKINNNQNNNGNSRRIIMLQITTTITLIKI